MELPKNKKVWLWVGVAVAGGVLLVVMLRKKSSANESATIEGSTAAPVGPEPAAAAAAPGLNGEVVAGDLEGLGRSIESQVPALVQSGVQAGIEAAASHTPQGESLGESLPEIVSGIESLDRLQTLIGATKGGAQGAGHGKSPTNHRPKARAVPHPTAHKPAKPSGHKKAAHSAHGGSGHAAHAHHHAHRRLAAHHPRRHGK